MKKAFVLTLAITLIFPAYCFASPGKLVIANDKSPLEEIIVAEIMWALEDGVVEQDEIDNIIEIAQLDDSCDYSIRLIMSGLFGAMVGMLGGGTWNITISYLMLTLILNAVINCFIMPAS
jgi:hypothetical protein